MRAVLIVLLGAMWLLTACGVKNGPRPPKPQPPPPTPQLHPFPPIDCERRGEFLYMDWLV